MLKKDKQNYDNKNQINSKERVFEHGEVFTNQREVKAMCDLVETETDRIDSRFLEPACGDGNFLAEILIRKLSKVKKRYIKRTSDYIRYSVIAVSSMYGIELLNDNVLKCRNRLFNIWKTQIDNLNNSKNDIELYNSIQYILERNIVCGDALTLKQCDGRPIMFSEWSFVSGDLVKRRDFYLEYLIQNERNNSLSSVQYSNKKRQLSLNLNQIKMKYTPRTPIKEYALETYRRLHYATR